MDRKAGDSTMNTMNFEELLSHADFVRYLARSLVFDDQGAADIAQETWVAALEHPVPSGRPVRAWLARVAANFSKKRHRSDSRRRARERATAEASGEAAPSAAEIAAREELRRRVVDAVQELEEPWRSTIVLRYYENLPHREVAARLGIPLETMRTRLKKGLALLRARLDREFRGSRQEWRLALAPLAGIDPGLLVSAGASSSGAAGLLGAIGISEKAVAAAVAALVLGAMLTVWFFFLHEPDPEAGGTIAAASGSDLEGERNSSNEAGADLAAGTDEAGRLPAREAVPVSSLEVVWRGKLIEYNDKPRGGVLIEPRLVKAFLGKEGLRENLATKSAEDGSFEITGLVPGEFSLHLSFSFKWGRPDKLEWGPVVFDEPGLVERDILVAEGLGAIVAGVVVDEETGEPVRRPPRQPDELISYYVGLNNPDHEGQGLSAEVDHETGTFCLRGLPSMLFDLYLLGPGLCGKILPAFVDTREDKIIDDIRLTVPPLGDLRIVVSGFSRKELRDLDVVFEGEWGRSSGPIRFEYRQGQIIAAPVGKGRVLFNHKDLGSAERWFEIRKGEVSEITLQHDDLQSGEPGTVDVKVTLRREDGTPLAGVTMGFEKNMRYRPNMVQPKHGGRTDSAGCLSIEKIEPGFWSAWCTPQTAEKFALLWKNKDIRCLDENLVVTILHGIEIPRSPAEIVTIDVVVPSGTIRGTFCDRTSGLPLHDEEIIMRWVMINEPGQAFRVSGISGTGPGSSNRFELTGIRAGRYQFCAAVFGYEFFRSDLFSFEPGESLDMGRVLLEPVGTMEIEVTDRAGNPLRFHASWEGQKGYISMFGHDRLPLSPGKTLFSDLPFGPLDVKVSAFGYEPKTITLEIERTRRARAVVVLDRSE